MGTRSALVDELFKGIPRTRSKRRKPVPQKVRSKKMYLLRKCGWCGREPVQQIHHIDGNPRNNRPRNLIGLCGTCHNKATKNEISKEQLRRRLGTKPNARKPRKRVSKQTIRIRPLRIEPLKIKPLRIGHKWP